MTDEFTNCNYKEDLLRVKKARWLNWQIFFSWQYCTEITAHSLSLLLRSFSFSRTHVLNKTTNYFKFQLWQLTLVTSYSTPEISNTMKFVLHSKCFVIPYWFVICNLYDSWFTNQGLHQQVIYIKLTHINESYLINIYSPGITPLKHRPSTTKPSQKWCMYW